MVSPLSEHTQLSMQYGTDETQAMIASQRNALMDVA